ncbi:MAG: DEAD/DEAH box helicase [Acidobacteria bacterium]|nr:DEAD/DEAH box helicase [Acidobacteriota bacterium]
MSANNHPTRDFHGSRPPKSDQSNPSSRFGFEHFDLGPALQRGIAALGFEEPRPIQTQALPAALAGRDVLGLAQTGTGKTAAFALPILQRILAAGPQPGPRALVVAPTRELAAQISAEIAALAKFTKIKVATVFGGVSVFRQRKALSAKPEIVVACPGRLLDLMGQGIVRLNRIETLILDEADHMFDMGFLPDIRRIIAALPAERQNLLFSATMPKEIRGLADRILRDPKVVDVEHSKPLETIEHALYPVESGRKVALLERILAADETASAIVFTRTKHRARRLAQQLERSGHRAVALQGNMSQAARDRAMDGFRKRRFDVLVATDIAARGIDVQGVSHVVNFDMPNTTDAYTHRIGRTGRSNNPGKAYTFVTAEDRCLVFQVEQRLGATIPRRQVDGIESIPFPLGRSDDRGSQPLGRPQGRPQGRSSPGNGKSNGRPRSRRARYRRTSTTGC